MSSKKHNKLPTQPTKIPEKLKVEISTPVSEVIPVASVEKEVVEVKKEEIYQPSVNADKYPAPKTPTIQYKILAFRNDYIKLQDEVVKHLNNGWQLAGGISSSMTVSPYESITIFTQAVVKY